MDTIISIRRSNVKRRLTKNSKRKGKEGDKEVVKRREYEKKEPRGK